MKKVNYLGWFASLSLTICLLLIASPIFADGGQLHQGRTNQFGSSGGNLQDTSKSFCCGGTLGSLVMDTNNNQYILSNSHVLARSGQAVNGEDIIQPGLIDVGCVANKATVVADFTVAPNLGSSNVDAAIAQLRTGTMDSGGSILDTGNISNVIKEPSVGLAVSKSGRTTGLTTGLITSVNTSVSVQYQTGCNRGKKFLVSYTNQLVITAGSGSFSAGGDSGSLILTNDVCHQPVGLLFAGNSTQTIGNPINEVLSKVSSALGSTVTFVGNTCSSSLLVPEASLVPEISAERLQYAIKVKNSREAKLMAMPGVIGVGIGALDENRSMPSLVVYVDHTTGKKPKLPKRIKGVKVKVVLTEPFVAQ